MVKKAMALDRLGVPTALPMAGRDATPTRFTDRRSSTDPSAVAFWHPETHT